MLLYSARAERTNPLEWLWVVDQALLDPDHPPVQRGRSHVLASILIDVITVELNHHRRVNGLSPSDSTQTRAEALRQIALDGQHQNIELLSWSWLYYRYVRVELNITPAEFGQAAHIEPRTRTRYRQHALRRLTERLIEREYQARRALRKRRLLARLPVAPPLRLFGRDADLSALTHALTDPVMRFVQVNGATGIGKSVLVREGVRTLIEADRLSHLVWIDRPISGAVIREQVRWWIPSVYFDDHVQVFDPQPALIVLDDLSDFHEPLSTLEQLFHQLAPLHICLIHPTYVPLSGFSVRLTLRPISINDARALIHWKTFVEPHFFCTETEFDALWENARGNLAVILRLLEEAKE